MRITAAAPVAMLDDCNALAMVLAFGPSDGLTYRKPSWVDAQGNLYSAASWVARPEWISAAQSPLERPEWDTNNLVNMSGAARAQAALVFWYPTEETPTPPQAITTALTAIAGMDGLAALEAMGLTGVEDDL